MFYWYQLYISSLHAPPLQNQLDYWFDWIGTQQIKIATIYCWSDFPVCETSSPCVDDYLDFTPRYQSKPDELEYFLRDPEVSIEMLDRYPQIKDLFMRFNTAIPSSAPVERLFSQAALVSP